MHGIQDVQGTTKKYGKVTFQQKKGKSCGERQSKKN